MSASETEEVDHWKQLRGILKAAILAQEIPVESKVMPPKAVWQKYKDANHPDIEVVVGDYTGKPREKFTRILRSLRKKHQEGDLENEDKPKIIKWSKSAAKQLLKKCFREKVIPSNYGDAEQVWKDHCKNEAAFARMQYDDTFVRRLGSVRDDYIKKVERSKKDQEAYNLAKQNHPTPKLDSRGRPQWNGSTAQKLLKEMIAEGKHVGKQPETIWKSKEAYRVYSLQTFRDHIYQEQRLLKFRNYTESLRKKKFDELQY